MAITIRDIYLPSLDAVGKTWRIYYHKPIKGPGLVCAVEGESEKTPDGTSFFKCVLFESRRFRHQLTGRATKRAIAQQLIYLLTEMHVAGVISRFDADKYIEQARAI